mmetsp:Transcript_20370/g.58159  ORF Transcript_20370/g.58159 Transcript_20370/m.58159 type:complete len:277 (-) Transcript_20370:569-1399(-)
MGMVCVGVSRVLPAEASLWVSLSGPLAAGLWHRIRCTELMSHQYPQWTPISSLTDVQARSRGVSSTHSPVTGLKLVRGEPPIRHHVSWSTLMPSACRRSCSSRKCTMSCMNAASLRTSLWMCCGVRLPRNINAPKKTLKHVYWSKLHSRCSSSSDNLVTSMRDSSLSHDDRSPGLASQKALMRQAKSAPTSVLCRLSMSTWLLAWSYTHIDAVLIAVIGVSISSAGSTVTTASPVRPARLPWVRTIDTSNNFSLSPSLKSRSGSHTRSRMKSTPDR